ncbi:low temperature requirement protein A [Nocardia sp. NPDC050712]|uniref:low temperature requirement protein A n=1 Tax=Nocardia sp. NPDC050712 TaxID=3155518 RepID=UPI003408908C
MHGRHASWIELFFDLVAVAGIGQLTHLLHGGPAAGDIALYVVLYVAFWMAWACITVYGDIAGDHTQTGLILSAMLGLGVMAAAVAGIPDRHATTFAAVYVMVRVGIKQVWHNGRILVDWPTVQMGTGVLPWVVSLWVGEPGKYWFWAAGLIIDLYLMFAISGDRMLARGRRVMRQRLRRSSRFAGVDAPKLEAIHADPEHLGERLGLFVIIVLGEGVIVVIAAVSVAAWTFPVLAVGFGSFLILAGLWELTLGFGPVPRLISGAEPAERVPWQHIMATHCALTGAIATVAAGLGMCVEHADGHLSSGIGWVLCGGAAAYFAVLTLGVLRSGSGRRTAIAYPIPGALGAVLLGVFAPRIGPLGMVYGVLVLVVWALLWQSHDAGRWRAGSGPARPHRRPRGAPA